MNKVLTGEGAPRECQAHLALDNRPQRRAKDGKRNRKSRTVRLDSDRRRFGRGSVLLSACSIPIAVSQALQVKKRRRSTGRVSPRDYCLYARASRLVYQCERKQQATLDGFGPVQDQCVRREQTRNPTHETDSQPPVNIVKHSAHHRITQRSRASTMLQTICVSSRLEHLPATPWQTMR